MSEKPAKFPFWATILTLIGVCILCGLGTWQLKRLQWKESVLVQLENAYTSAEALDLTNPGNDQQFLYGTLKGKFLFEKSILLGHAVQDQKAGTFLITPLLIHDGKQEQTVLVHLGFNPEDLHLNQTHPLYAYNNKSIEFTGLAQKPQWNSFTPENDPQNDNWYRPDIQAIATAQELKPPVLEYILYAEKASSVLADGQLPNNTRWTPNNNHLQYAVFWFTMAIVLVAIYALRFFKYRNESKD